MLASTAFTAADVDTSLRRVKGNTSAGPDGTSLGLYQGNELGSYTCRRRASSPPSWRPAASCPPASTTAPSCTFTRRGNRTNPQLSPNHAAQHRLPCLHAVAGAAALHGAHPCHRPPTVGLAARSPHRRRHPGHAAAAPRARCRAEQRRGGVLQKSPRPRRQQQQQPPAGLPPPQRPTGQSQRQQQRGSLRSAAVCLMRTQRESHGGVWRLVCLVALPETMAADSWPGAS